MKFQSPKGTRDFWGAEFYARQQVKDTILSVMESYGFRQAASPMFESRDLLAKDAGEEVTGQIYKITDKAGRVFGLKSDITPAMTRIVANQGASVLKPIKIACSDRVYRYERPQKGRYREIYQINAEMFGVKSAASDAELARCFYDCYQALGLEKIKILIGYRPLLESFVTTLVDESQVKSLIRLIDKKDKLEQAAFSEQLDQLGFDQKKLEQLNSFLELQGEPKAVVIKAQKLLSEDFDEYLQNLAEIAEALSDYELEAVCEFNLGIARGSEYYTGIIFEARYPGQLDKSIGGGGRYDNLVEFYGGKPTPAVGFSIGIDRVYEVMEDVGVIEPKEPVIDYYIVSETSKQSLSVARKLANQLRAKGKNVEVNLNDDYFGEQLMLAKKLNAKQAVIIKDELLAYDLLNVLDLETVEEESVTLLLGIKVSEIKKLCK